MKHYFLKALLCITLLGFAKNAYTQITFTISNPSSNFTLNCYVPTITFYSSSDYTNSAVSYTWTNSQQISYSDSMLVISPGVYTVVAGSGNLVSTPQTFTVFANINPPTLTVSATANALTCTQPLIQLQASSSTPGVIYDWYYFSTQTGSLLPVNAPGIYTLVATNSANGCTTATIITILDNRVYPVIFPSTSTLQCLSVGPATISASGVGNQSSLTYSWSTPPNANTTGNGTGTLTTDQPGQYQLTVTNTTYGCESKALFEVSLCVNIKEENESFWMHTFPNPVQDILYFKSSLQKTEPVKLTLTNLLGGLVFVLEEIEPIELIDVSHLSPGIYYLNIQSGQKQQSYKVLKQ